MNKEVLDFLQWVLDQHEVDTREAQDRAEQLLRIKES